MEIRDFLCEKAISVDLQTKDKRGVIEEMVDLLITAESVKAEDKDAIIKTLMNRESLGSTGIGQNIGIPHGKIGCVDSLVAALGISQEGVDFDSLDGEPVHIFILLVAPEDSAGPHLKALARISRFLKDRLVRQSLMKAGSAQEIMEIIKTEELASQH